MRAFFAVTAALFILFPLHAMAQGYAPLQASARWLNTPRPLSETDMQGRAVLLDFWTYGCINCMQIVPDLDDLEKRFGSKLLVIGVHSAKFKGEQGSDRILAAAKRFGLNHPVINDADFAIWNAFNVKAWPTQILLGPDGREIGRWSGEGHRGEIEKAIAGLKLGASGKSAIETTRQPTGTWSFPARIKGIEDRLYIADTGHNQIVVAKKDGMVMHRIGNGAKGLKDGSLTNALFNQPHGLAVKGDKIYVADTGNHALRIIDLSKNQVRTIAGDGTRGRPGNLASPWDVAFFKNIIAVANAGTHQILGFDPETRQLSVLAGSARENLADGPAAQAALAQPSALAVDDNTLYFVDAESSALRSLHSGQVKTLIGTGLFDFGMTDGQFPKARLQHPQGLSVAGRMIFIADTYNNAIRVYDSESRVLSTLKTTGAALNEPGDIFVSGNEACVADTGNHAVFCAGMADAAMNIPSAIPFSP